VRAHRQSLTEDARYDDFPREHDEEEEQNCVEDAVRIIGRISNHPEIRQEKRCHQGQGEETLGEPVVENHGQAVKSPLHRGPVHGAAAAPGSGMSLPRRLYLHRLDLIHQRRGTVQVSSSGRASVTGSQVAWTPAPSRELQRPHLHVVFFKKSSSSQHRSDDDAVFARAVGSVCRRKLVVCRVPKRDETFFRRRWRAFAVFFVNESIAFARKRRHHLTRNHSERKRRRNDDVVRGIFVHRRQKGCVLGSL